MWETLINEPEQNLLVECITFATIILKVIESLIKTRTKVAKPLLYRRTFDEL